MLDVYFYRANQFIWDLMAEKKFGEEQNDL